MKNTKYNAVITKGPKPFTGNKQARRQFVERLLNAIAAKHPGRRVENIISDMTGISTYAVKAWRERGIAKPHRALIAQLSGVSLAEIQAAHGSLLD